MERQINSAHYHTNVTSIISGSGYFTTELFVQMSYYNKQVLPNKQKHQSVTKSIILFCVSDTATVWPGLHFFMSALTRLLDLGCLVCMHLQEDG